jgi:hypothetical protein
VDAQFGDEVLKAGDDRQKKVGIVVARSTS